MVESGTRTIIVPCNYWVPRQSMRVQTLLLFNVVLGVVFVVSVFTDWARYHHRRRTRSLLKPPLSWGSPEGDLLTVLALACFH